MLVFCLVVGIMAAAAVYLLLDEAHFERILGLVLLGNALNLALLTLGGLGSRGAPLIPEGSEVAVGEIANPLSQALVLTAIVIGLGVTGYALALMLRRARRAPGAESRARSEDGLKDVDRERQRKAA